MRTKILIVEDEYLISRNLRNILLEDYYEVINEIESVEEAIEILEKENINLVLVDINLKKDKDGVELGHYLLEKATIPFIYITSYSDKITLNRASETRPQAYLVKPFKAIDVKTTVAIVLNNFSLRKIDNIRIKEEAIDEIPFILKKTIDYIHENIKKHFIIDELYKTTPWKEQHFYRIFKRYVGQTPLSYITRKKIEIAKSQLIETNIPARQISYELSFTSHGNFCSSFKSYTGKTPDEFRKIRTVNKLRFNE